LKEQAQLPKNITTADLSFHSHVHTNVLSTNIHDLISSFLNDSDSVLEQFDLEILCLNHTLPAKGSAFYQTCKHQVLPLSIQIRDLYQQSRIQLLVPSLANYCTTSLEGNVKETFQKI